MKKRCVAFFMMMMLGISSGTVAMAADTNGGDVQTQNVSAARAASCSGAFRVNGKRYTCRTTFTWKKQSTMLYYGGIKTECLADTKRVYQLSVIANTVHHGYKTYSGKVTVYTGANDSRSTLVRIPEELDTVKYKGYSGSCDYQYSDNSKDYKSKYTAYISAP